MPERADDLLIGRIAAELRTPVAADPTADGRIMAAIRAEPQPARGGSVAAAWAWLREPRTLRVSPLAGLAAAAGVVGLLALAVRTTRSLNAPDTVAAPRASAAVEFVFVAPAAHTVSLVGDFNDWDPSVTPLKSAGAGGVWTTTVPLPAGRHRYAFLVDGARWLADPSAPPAADDAFGTPNSVVTVGT